MRIPAQNPTTDPATQSHGSIQGQAPVTQHDGSIQGQAPFTQRDGSIQGQASATRPQVPVRGQATHNKTRTTTTAPDPTTRPGEPAPFETAHPAVPALFTGAAMAMGMFVLQPVYVGICLAGALLCCAAVCGAAETLRKLRWALPTLALVCLANPFFSAMGSTEVWHVGSMVIYAESLAFGACMGSMLVATILWMECLGRALTPDKVLSTAGRALPTLSLMTSIALGLVPQLMRRANLLRNTTNACTCGTVEASRHGTLARLSTMLLSWSLEDSLERADSMRARGWSPDAVRTSYRTYVLRTRDLVALGVGVALATLCALLGNVAATQWHFYPTMPRLVMWWGYLPYALLSLTPGVAVLVERAWIGRAALRPARTNGGEQNA